MGTGKKRSVSNRALRTCLHIRTRANRLAAVQLESVFSDGVLEVNRVEPPLNQKFTVAFCMPEGKQKRMHHHNPSRFTRQCARSMLPSDFVAGERKIENKDDELYYTQQESMVPSTVYQKPVAYIFRQLL